MASVHISKRGSSIGLALLIATLVVCLYASTLMTTISGCAHQYCADVGEFQVALPLWGTVHYTGYPLYMLLGSPFVKILQVLGIPAAMGASLYSLLWETLAVVGLVMLVRRLSDSLWLAGGIGLLFAVLEPIWVHGVLAEVYSLSMALSVAVLNLTFDLRENWSDKRGWLLALLGGAAVAHHRLLALLLILAGLYLLPSALRSRSFPRWLIIAGLGFMLGFLPYLDIPLRIGLGSTWNYDQANTWPGFWRIFRGEEVAGLQQPSLALPALLSAAQDISQALISQLTWPGLVLMGLLAARGAWKPQSRSAAWFMLGIGASYVLFILFFRNAVLIQATLMSALLALCILLAIGLSSLKASWQNIAGAICLGWAAWLAMNNWPLVTSLTRAQDGVVYAAVVEKLEAPDDSLVMAPWGADYFALAYAQRLEGRMAQWQIVDHRANFGNLTASASHRVYMHSKTLYIFGPDWWAEKLGSPLRISSAGLDIPTADYSTFVHVSDQDLISKPADLIAQSDHSAPVYGWYPTFNWLPNEIVREDHRLQFRPGRSPRTISIGMYRQDASGVFHQLGQVLLRPEAGAWLVVPEASP